MARTEVVREGQRRRAGTVSGDVRSARVAKALRLLARNADRMHFSEGQEEWDSAGARNGRIWRAIESFGISDEVLAGLRGRRGKLPPAVRNWRRARLARATASEL